MLELMLGWEPMGSSLTVGEFDESEELKFVSIFADFKQNPFWLTKDQVQELYDYLGKQLEAVK